MFEGFEILHTYTRADAINDGFLVDVSDTAKEAGFRYPVALTRACWDTTVEWTDAIAQRSRALQDEAGRLWDVVWMASRAALAASRRNLEGPIIFSLYVVPCDGSTVTPRLMRLRLTLDGGDDGRGAFLVSLPNEDL